MSGFQRLFDQYPWSWDTIRRQVYRRDNWTCQKCGATNTKLYAHHINHLADGGSNDMGNLTTLCSRCHENRHPHLWMNNLVLKFCLWFFIAMCIIAVVFVFFAGHIVK